MKYFFSLFLLSSLTLFAQTGKGDFVPAPKVDAKTVHPETPDTVAVSPAIPSEFRKNTSAASPIVSDTLPALPATIPPLRKRHLAAPEVAKQFIRRVNCKEKLAALTFDDGPGKSSAALMDFLRQKHIPATFFILTQNLNKHYAHLYAQPEPLFEFALHSHRHPRYSRLTKEAIEADFYTCLQTAAGYNIHSKLFRPPYGIINSTLAELLGKNQMKGIMWTIDTEDWKKNNGQDVVQVVENGLRNGAIILFHDKINLADLERVIAAVQNRGYTFVTVSTLLNADREIHTAKIKNRIVQKKFASEKR